MYLLKVAGEYLNNESIICVFPPAHFKNGFMVRWIGVNLGVIVDVKIPSFESIFEAFIICPGFYKQ